MLGCVYRETEMKVTTEKIYIYQKLEYLIIFLHYTGNSFCRDVSPEIQGSKFFKLFLDFTIKSHKIKLDQIF